jgi:hypothetical protein
VTQDARGRPKENRGAGNPVVGGWVRARAPARGKKIGRNQMTKQGQPVPLRTACRTFGVHVYYRAESSCANANRDRMGPAVKCKLKTD